VGFVKAGMITVSEVILTILLAEFASIGSPVQPAEQGTEAD